MRKLLLLSSITLLSACSTVSYYAQSIQGQFNILLKREEIEDVINAPETSPKLKSSLQQAVEIRHFASKQIHLPENKSYLFYADLERPYVVWNVFAAPEFSLEPKTWCYFIVGCVSYRGYFDQKNADRTASALSQENYDVHVAGIAAYSTLGWFNDPLLNTMMHWNIRSLASLIFHELSHQVIYIPNETGFNEAFATAVERLATIQWLLSTNPDNLPGYLQYLNAQRDFRELVLNTRNKLETLYQSTITVEEKRLEKKQIIEQMLLEYKTVKSSWDNKINFDSWFEQPVNNARLTSTMTYLQQVPAFFQIFNESSGEWRLFFENVKKLESLDANERESLIANKTKEAPDLQHLVTLIQNNLQ